MLSLMLAKTEHFKGRIVHNQLDFSKIACVSYEHRSGLAQDTEEGQ